MGEIRGLISEKYNTMDAVVSNMMINTIVLLEYLHCKSPYIFKTFGICRYFIQMSCQSEIFVEEA